MKSLGRVARWTTDLGHNKKREKPKRLRSSSRGDLLKVVSDDKVEKDQPNVLRGQGTEKKATGLET